jgi:hypothetical protein
MTTINHTPLHCTPIRVCALVSTVSGGVRMEESFVVVKILLRFSAVTSVSVSCSANNPRHSFGTYDDSTLSAKGWGGAGPARPQNGNS